MSQATFSTSIPDANAMSSATSAVHRLFVFLLLVTLMTCVYLLSYRAVIQAGDTRRALDAVTSLARYGDWLMDESNWVKPPLRIREADSLPLSQYEVEERLNIQLALPLLRLAETLPRLGNIHTVWLLNILICALNCGLIYLILRQMRYGDAVAISVAVSAGIGTNLWAYSQTFFREPMAAFFILAALLTLQIGRHRRFIVWLASLILSALCLLAAADTKYSALLALPALLVFAVPSARQGNSQTQRRLSQALLLVSLLLLILPMLLEPLPLPLHDLLSRLRFSGEHIGDALRTYIISPGAAIWATSPLLLLALAGGALLWRRRQYRLIIFAAILLASYTLGHAILTGSHWFGGLSWPPRFLLPVVPPLMLLTAPVAEKILLERHRLFRYVWLALLIYGIWIQFCGVSLSWNHYSDSLPPESNGLAEWQPSLWQPPYFRWFVLPARWNDLGIDFLWTRAQLPIWGISFALLAGAIALALLRIARRPRSRWRLTALPLAALCLALILLNITAAYFKDPRTQSHQRALHDALDYLVRNANERDVLLLPGNDYGDFILNHLDGPAPRAVILPRPLAQAASDKQPAQVISQHHNDWFDVLSLRAISHLAGGHDRLWLLDNTSPFMTWSFRPLERYLASHYYPIRQVSLEHEDDTVRLLEYSVIHAAPNPHERYLGDIPTDLRFGDGIRLRSIALASGAGYRPGDVIALSLLWQSAAPLDDDYTVAWFIVDAATDQPLAQGWDTGPQAGFAPTSSWKVEKPVWDHRAMRLPASAPPGKYLLWVLMYHYDAAANAIDRLPVSGAQVAESGTAGVLPISLTIG